MKGASNEDSHSDSAIYEALKYSDIDIKRLIDQNNPSYVIGAAYQFEKSKSVSFLKEYFSMIKNKPEGLSLLVCCALQEFERFQQMDFEHLTNILIKKDKENSYPYYIKAYYFSKIDNPEKCLYYTKKANSKKIFNNYYTELSNISISTSVFLGYSRFAAQSYALGLQPDIVIFSGLSKYLTKKTFNPEYKIECLKMGVTLRKNSKTLLNDFLSYAVQIRALNEMKGKDNEIQDVEKEKKDTMNVLEMAHAIEEDGNIPEDRWVEYFDDLYSQSETFAILKLSKEYLTNKQ